MIIVKLTILSHVLTVIMFFIGDIWVDSNPIDAFMNNYPKWIIVPLRFLIIFDIIGILLSTIWLLFFR